MSDDDFSFSLLQKNRDLRLLHMMYYYYYFMSGLIY